MRVRIVRWLSYWREVWTAPLREPPFLIQESCPPLSTGNGERCGAGLASDTGVPSAGSGGATGGLISGLRAGIMDA
jgi:hypothetical protein